MLLALAVAAAGAAAFALRRPLLRFFVDPTGVSAADARGARGARAYLAEQLRGTLRVLRARGRRRRTRRRLVAPRRCRRALAHRAARGDRRLRPRDVDGALARAARPSATRRCSWTSVRTAPPAARRCARRRIADGEEEDAAPRASTRSDAAPRSSTAAWPRCRSCRLYYAPPGAVRWRRDLARGCSRRCEAGRVCLVPGVVARGALTERARLGDARLDADTVRIACAQIDLADGLALRRVRAATARRARPRRRIADTRAAMLEGGRPRRGGGRASPCPATAPGRACRRVRPPRAPAGSRLPSRTPSSRGVDERDGAHRVDGPPRGRRGAAPARSARRRRAPSSSRTARTSARRAARLVGAQQPRPRVRRGAARPRARAPRGARTRFGRSRPTRRERRGNHAQRAAARP